MGKRISSALNRAEPYIALRLIIDKSLRTYTSVEGHLGYGISVVRPDWRIGGYCQTRNKHVPGRKLPGSEKQFFCFHFLSVEARPYVGCLIYVYPTGAWYDLMHI